MEERSEGSRGQRACPDGSARRWPKAQRKAIGYIKGEQHQLRSDAFAGRPHCSRCMVVQAGVSVHVWWHQAPRPSRTRHLNTGAHHGNDSPVRRDVIRQPTRLLLQAWACTLRKMCGCAQTGCSSKVCGGLRSVRRRFEGKAKNCLLVRFASPN